jgi:cytochrome P450
MTPGPPRGLIAWRLLTRGNLLEVLEELEPYGDVVRWSLAGRPFYLLRSPAHVEHVLISNQAAYGKSSDYELLSVLLGKGLLTNEGESWTRQRRLIQPMFAKRHLGQFAEHMTTAIGEFVDDWGRRREGERVDVATAMDGLTLDIVGRALFGAHLVEHRVRMREAVLTGLRSEMVASRLQLILALPRPLVELGVWLFFRLPLPLPRLRRLRDALVTIDEVVNGVIALRRASPEGDPADLLGLLLSARHEDGSPMSDRQVRDELVTFLMAGTETLALTLAWMWHMLAGSRHARERLFAEVDDVLGDRVPTVEDAERLTWTRAAFEEALRMHPPVWVFDRQARTDDEIDGHQIPAGATVLLPTYLIHRDPRLWPNPNAFDPRRFLPERSSDRPRGAYFPFGAGRRVCMGGGFAILEATLITAMIAQRFRLEDVADAHIEPETTVVLRPRHGIPMTLHRRSRQRQFAGRASFAARS